MQANQPFLLYILSLLLFNMLNSEVIEKVEVRGKDQTEYMMSNDVDVITSEELEQKGISDFISLFKYLNGVSVSRRGPGSVSYDITMRGGNFEQVLLLVNGIPVNNPQTGHFNTDFTFSIEDIEKIEVSAGSSTVLNGINGYTGSINIILKHSSGYRMRISAGERSLNSFYLGAGSRRKHSGFGFSLNRSQSRGYYSGQEYLQYNARANFFIRTPAFSGTIDAGFLNKEFGAENFYGPFPSFEKISAGNMNVFIDTVGKAKFKFYFSHAVHHDNFILDRYKTALFSSDSKTSQTALKIHHRIDTGYFIFSSGIDLTALRINNSVFGVHSQDNQGLYMTAGYIRPHIGVDAGVRISFITGSNPELTYNAGPYFVIGKSGVIRFSVGKSLRLPTFTEKYYNSPANKGNPELVPEKNHNYELSYSGKTGRFNFSLFTFFRNQDELIDWIRTDDSSVWNAVNIERNDMVGYGLNMNYDSGNNGLDVSLEKLIVLDYAGLFSSKYGYRFPELKISISMAHKLSHHLFMGSHFIYKKIFETGEQAYLLDLTMKYRTGNFELILQLDNILNSIIEEIPGNRISGRWFRISLNYKK